MDAQTCASIEHFYSRDWDGWMALPTQWTSVWVNSWSWWWTGRPGVLQSMGLQRVKHDWATELNWTEPFIWLLSTFGWSINENLTFDFFFHLHANCISMLCNLKRFSSVAQYCLTICVPMNRSTPGLPVHHQLQEFTQTHPASQWCHPPISSSVVPFSSSLQSFPASGSFPQSFTRGQKMLH